MAPLCIQLEYMVIFGQIFFCLVFWSPCYTLSRKEKNKIIRGGTGNTWGRNFYMGTQNGSKNEIWHEKILIHALELKLRPFEVSPYVYTGKPCVCNVSAHALREGRDHAHMNVTTFTNFLTKLKFRLPSCIVWFHYASSSIIIWCFLDNFFSA